MGYIISFGYSQGAIWFYNLRAPQICFRNFWDQKIDQVETQDGCALAIQHVYNANAIYMYILKPDTKNKLWKFVNL